MECDRNIDTGKVNSRLKLLRGGSNLESEHRRKNPTLIALLPLDTIFAQYDDIFLVFLIGWFISFLLFLTAQRLNESLKFEIFFTPHPECSIVDAVLLGVGDLNLYW